MKKLFFYFLVGVTLISCSKSDDKNGEAFSLLNDNGIDTKGLTIQSDCFRGVYILGQHCYAENYFYHKADLIEGYKNNHFVAYLFKGLEDYQKEKKPMTLIGHFTRNIIKTKDDSREFDLGYGNHIRLNWENCSIAKILEVDNITYAIIFDDYSNKDHSQGSAVFSLLIQNGSSQKEIEIPGTIDSGFENMIYGINNTIIIPYKENDTPKIQCYSKDGELLYQYNRSIFFNTGQFFSSNNKVYYPLSEKNFVVIGCDLYRANVTFVNLDSENTLQYIVFKNANDNDRIDSLVFVKKEANLLYYQLNETKYSGEKITRIIIVDTENKTIKES